MFRFHAILAVFVLTDHTERFSPILLSLVHFLEVVLVTAGIHKKLLPARGLVKYG